MREIYMWWFFMGCAVGECMMFAFYGMMQEMVLMGVIALVLNGLINYMKNGKEKNKAKIQ